MNSNKEPIIPVSRYKRNLNGLIRSLNNGKIDVVKVSRLGIVVACMISNKRFEELNNNKRIYHEHLQREVIIQGNLFKGCKNTRKSVWQYAERRNCCRSSLIGASEWT